MLTATADPVRHNETVETVTPTRLELVALSHLVPSPLNPRRRFDGLEELARNLTARGVVVPLLVRRRPTDDIDLPVYEVVDGERRYRAAQIAHLTTVPVIVRDLTDGDVIEIQLVSAVQRADLTPLEEARGYRSLIDANPSRYSAAYIGDRIGRSERYVVDRMRLLALIPELQRLLEQERIGVAHADVLAKLKSGDQARAAHPGDREAWGRSGEPGGLWQPIARTLDLRDDDEDAPTSTDPYEGLKVATVKELEAWVARHVRFDIVHAATTAPLEFGRVQQQIAAAEEKPGRGKKTIQITHDHHLQDEVKDAPLPERRPAQMDKQLLRPREAARILNISLSTCYELISRGEIPAIRLGKSLRVPVRDLEEKIDQLRVRPGDGGRPIAAAARKLW